MQSIDQQAAYIYIQAAASQTSGQPLSRNSRIQTPNSCCCSSGASTTPSAAEYATMFSGWRTHSSSSSDYSDGSSSCSLTGAGVPSGVRVLRTVKS